jgi:hypothetical protein
MEPEAQHAHVEHIIERSGDVMPSYLSEKIGRDYGAPYGGWTNERELATVYTESRANEILRGPLSHVAVFCKVVTK